nr:hypothetical protein [Tanacetum cinerariifolium]
MAVSLIQLSVKKLVIGGYNDPEDEWELSDIVKINVPHIFSLEIIMFFLLWKVVLIDVSSLVEAELDYQKGGHYETRSKEGKEEMLKGLILRLRHTLARLEAKGFTFPSNLKYPDWPDYAIDSSGSEDCWVSMVGSVGKPFTFGDKGQGFDPHSLQKGRRSSRSSLSTFRLSCGFVLELLKMKVLS